MPKKPYVKAPNAPKPQMGRILKDLFSNYKKRLTLVIFCIMKAINGLTSKLQKKRSSEHRILAFHEPAYLGNRESAESLQR